jgi:hypothetical protein
MKEQVSTGGNCSAGGEMPVVGQFVNPVPLSLQLILLYLLLFWLELQGSDAVWIQSILPVKRYLS